MRPLSLLLLLACAGAGDKNPPAGTTDDTASVDTGAPDDTAAPPPAWDSLGGPIDCGDDGPADLLDAALADAGLDDLVFTEEDWAAASYRRYLNDDMLLPWFRELHWAPLQVPCFGGQLAADLDAAALTPHPVATAIGVAMALLDTPGAAAPPTAASQSTADLSSLPPDLAEALTPILAAMEAVAAARTAIDVGAPTSARNLVKMGHGGVMLDYRSAPDLTDPEVQAWVLDPVAGPRAFYAPAQSLAWAIEQANLGRFAGQDLTFDQETALGRVIIAGPGSDEPGALDGVALYLDLGGDDVYVYDAGANGEDNPVSVHIDLGGADHYNYLPTDAGDADLLPADEDGRYPGDDNYGPFSLSKVGRQGSGRYGVGMLFDLGGGADDYRSLRMSQGWGSLGVGVLYDDGGDDSYQGEAGVQGASSMGIGLFLDAGAGTDSHRSFTDSQGFGYVRGAGLAYDGGGADTWFVNPGKVEDGGRTIYYSPQLPGNGNSSFSQGIGFGMRNDGATTFLSGGVGVLRDAGGDDRYTAATFAQGSGYWQGAGFLLDGGGADAYDAYYYVQGGAAHYSLGALLDDGPEGDTVGANLTPNYMHFGAGHDFSVGVFVNEGGDDLYTYAGLAAGASNCQGIGLFVDNGGADTYLANSEYSTGLGNHSTECETRTAARSQGIFVDSGGEADVYTFPAGASRAPADDSVFGIAWTGTADEHGGAIDGDGPTAVHAAGSAP